MEKEDIEKLIKDSTIKIIDGEIYNVFECCIKVSGIGVKITSKTKDGQLKRRRVCTKHNGDLLAKFKVCDTCSSTVIGRLVKKGRTCPNCRSRGRKVFRLDHRRGMYCRHYVVEEYGCFVCDDCWYCDGFSPIFKGTGPKQKTRRL